MSEKLWPKNIGQEHFRLIVNINVLLFFFKYKSQWLTLFIYHRDGINEDK